MNKVPILVPPNDRSDTVSGTQYPLRGQDSERSEGRGLALSPEFGAKGNGSSLLPLWMK